MANAAAEKFTAGWTGEGRGNPAVPQYKTRPTFLATATATVVPAGLAYPNNTTLAKPTKNDYDQLKWK